MKREEIINRVFPDFTENTGLDPSVLENILVRYSAESPSHLESYVVGSYIHALEIFVRLSILKDKMEKGNGNT